MRKSVSIAILLIALLLFGNSKAYCAALQSKSCRLEHVSDTIGRAEEEDIIEVPAGKCTWGEKIVVNKRVTIRGAGISQTIVGPYGFDIDDGVDNVRITGFTFDGGDNSPVSQTSPPFLIGNPNSVGAKNFRIDHCKFLNYTNASASFWYVIRINGYSYGLIDNVIFEDCGGETIWIVADTSTAWSRSKKVGQYTNGTVFIENCSFVLTSDASGTIRNAIDANAGARFVLRYSTFKDHKNKTWTRFLEVHGACSRGSGPREDASIRGVVSAEIYENTFTTFNSGVGNWYNIRGGRGVVYNNRLIGRNWGGNLLTLTNFRSSSNLCVQCDNSLARQFASCPEQGGGDDYPARDQVNNLYIWNNTYGTSGTENLIIPVLTGDYCVPYHIKAGRDYFTEKMSAFKPYDYPHPLIEATSILAAAPAPPKKLRIQ